MGFFSNMRKPEGKLGNIQLKSMNKEHTPVSLWGLKHLNISPDDVILDIGYSIESVNLSKEVNEDLIKEGRVEVHEGNVMDLPFEDNSFDIVTAFETVYFWPDIVKSFGEVKRVLKPGGMFLIGCEANGTNNLAMKFFDKVVDMTFYEDNDLVGFLKSNDFKDVTVYLRDGKNKQEIIKKEDGKTVKIDDDYDNFSISDRFVEWMTVTAIK